ncbi:MAG: PEP-CTERM/exosortase system-associated acyltransferase [Xenococcaceae cyanobacterium MO_188.B19]|nr:PEP-CTERM/exosortase system-associated acyltransferase [Xenococcaceae cyanobacterium MO_188.B19]
MSYDIAQHFFNYFSLSIADTPELQQEVYKIRYQVYCEELQYEPKEEFLNGMEQDIYDSRSIHCLLRHRISDRYIGCVRLVLPDPEQLDDQFSLEKIFQHDFQLTETEFYNYAEISRLAIIGDFRKRQGENTSSVGLLFADNQPDSLPNSQDRRIFPLTLVSLYLGCTSLLMSFNIKNALTVMEAKLSRHLRLCGIPSCLIGDFVNFHGEQAPFLLSPTNIMTSMDSEVSTLFNAIHSELKVKIDNHPLKSKYQPILLTS